MDAAEHLFAEHVKAELAAIKRLLGDKTSPCEDRGDCEDSDERVRIARLEREVGQLKSAIRMLIGGAPASAFQECVK